MKGTRAAVRYAKAFMQLSKENNSLETAVADLKYIRAIIEESRDFELMLKSPLIKMEKKRTVVSAVLGKKVDDGSLKFVDHVVRQGREAILGNIATAFVEQYNELKNIAQVSVISSQALAPEMKERLLISLKSKYNFSEIELEEKVDASLIGGMVLRIGDKQIDASIRRQLNDIKQELVHA